MEGKKVKEILKQHKVSLKELAEKMQETPQNLQSMLNAKDVKTGVIERIVEALGKDFSFFFGDVSAPIQHVSGTGNTAVQDLNSETARFLSLLEKKDEQIDRLLSLLELNSKK